MTAKKAPKKILRVISQVESTRSYVLTLTERQTKMLRRVLANMPIGDVLDPVYEALDKALPDDGEFL